VKRLETNNKRLLPPQAIAGKVRISRKKRISKIALTKDFCFFLSIALHGLGVSSPEFVTGMRGDSDFFLSCMMLLLFSFILLNPPYLSAEGDICKNERLVVNYRIGTSPAFSISS
jgi:hypothetical protein